MRLCDPISSLPKVSIVVPVFNVERYLGECLDSIAGQTLKDIEIVCVDDGSTDGSGRILDAYAAHDPRVKVIHQANAGAGPARNVGMDHAVGTYLYFCDPDDFCRSSYLSVMARRADCTEADIVCSCRTCIDGNTGELLGYRHFPDWVWDFGQPFDPRTMADELFSVATSVPWDKLFRRSFVVREQLRFQSLPRSNDIFFVCMALASASRVALAPSAGCCHRMRRPGSLQNTKDRSPEAVYEAYSALLAGLKERGLSKTFSVGFAVALLHSAHVHLRGLEQEANRRLSVERLKSLMSAASPFMSAAQLESFVRRGEHSFWKFLENGYDPSEKLEGGGGFLSDERPWHYAWRNLRARRGGRVNFVDMEGGWLVVSGFVVSPYHNWRERMFSVRFPLKRCEIACVCGVPWGEMRHGWYSPFTQLTKWSYAVMGGWILRSRHDCLAIRPYSFARKAALETLYRLMLLRRFSRVTLKALVARVAVPALRCLRRRPIWIFSDRMSRADDNGRAMFDYVRGLDNVKPRRRCVFAIDARSPDFEEMRRSGGEVVDAAGWRYKALFLLSDFVISAYHTPAMRMPFCDDFIEYAKSLVNRPKFIYLRHGIGEKGLAHICNRRNDNAAVMVTTVEGEYRSVLDGGTGYTEKQVKLTGLPRYDLLYDDRKKLVTFMPTWRNYLIEWSGDGRHRLAAGAERSRFVAEWNRILTDDRLIAACDRLGYTLQMMPHPNLAAVVPILSHDAKIRMLPSSTPYKKVFAESDMIVTDYSAAAFDFAYLRKPLLYFQSDRREFFSGLYKPGFFDYDRDGLGKVETTVEGLVDEIIHLMESGCQLPPEYRQRADSFFAYNDHENRRRVYEAILDVPKNRI